MTQNLEGKLFRRALWKTAGFEPHEQQRRFLDSEARIKTAVCGTKWGKSTTLKSYHLEGCFLPVSEIKNACIAPSYDQAMIVFDGLFFLLKKIGARIVIDHHKTDPAFMRVANPKGDFADVNCFSTKDPRTLFGYKWHRATIDEGAQMPSEIWFNYLASNVRDVAIATTPEAPGEWIETFYLYGKEHDRLDYESWNFDSFANTKMPGYSADGNHTGDYADMLREAKLCEKYFPETYKKRYLGQFTGGGASFFKHYRQCAYDNYRWNRATGVIEQPRSSEYYSFGWDIGRVNDPTVGVGWNRKREMVYLRILDSQDWPVIEMAFSQAKNSYGGTHHIDSTGMGMKFAEDMAAKFSVGVEPINFARNAANGNNIRSEIITEVNIRTVDMACIFPAIPEIIESFNKVKISRTEGGREIIGDSRGHLPDIIAAMGLGLWGLKDMPHRFQMEEKGFTMIKQPDGGWDGCGRPIHKEEKKSEPAFRNRIAGFVR